MTTQSKTETQQHTPGPWTWERGAPLWYFRLRADGRTIAVFKQAMKQVSETESVGLSDNEIAANVRIAAAAPDMLSALLVAVDYSEHTDECDWNKHIDNKFCNCWKRQARAAIAKATGAQS